MTVQHNVDIVPPKSRDNEMINQWVVKCDNCRWKCFCETRNLAYEEAYTHIIIEANRAKISGS